MRKRDQYLLALQNISHWDEFLLENSGLPGLRGNLELAGVVADLGDRPLFERYSALTADLAPVNSPLEFLAFCGVLGLGRLLAEGDSRLLPVLRIHASDPRWRTREAVAMALQRLGDVDMELLLISLQAWSVGSPYEQRAAAAGLCEPRLLHRPEHAQAVLGLLDQITATISASFQRCSEEFLALRKGLAYCWSVAVAADPASGKSLIEKWILSPDQDVRWIMRMNLKKDRLVRIDSAWVQDCLARLSAK